MLAELRRRLPAVRVVPGRAEEIPLPDGAVDAVLAGQAMHWFDLDRALPELARVLAPGGVLAGLWNVDDDRAGWVAELADVSKRKASVTLRRWREGANQGREERWPIEGSAWFEAAGDRGVRPRAAAHGRLAAGHPRHPLPPAGDARQP